MTTFQIVEAKSHHCGQIIRRMRMEHQQILLTMGINAHRELRRQFDGSSYRRAWLIDGELAALGGVHGMRLSAWGFIWLVLTERATRYPVAVVKEARRQLEEIMIVKRELATTVFPGDEAAKRLAIFLGFHISHDGSGAPAFSRHARKQLADSIDHNTDIRIPIGPGYAVPLGYHLEAE